MDKVIKKIIKYLKKHLKPVRAHALEMLLMNISGNTTIVEIDLEFVNYCNLRCKWCSLDHAQKKDVLSEGLLRKFLENLLNDKRFRSVKRLNLFNGGETLLHPDFIGMMKIMKEYKSKFLERGRPFPAIDLLTNATPLREGLSRELIGLDIVDTMRFSVDGGSRQKYEELRPPAKWDTASKNIMDFIKINNGRVRTGIICIIEHGKPENTEWMTDEFKALCGAVDHVELRYPHDWMGDVKVEGHRKVFKNYCKFLFHSLCVLPNGDVAVCCGDLNGKKGVAGNLNKEDLYKVYSSRRRRELRYELLKGRRDRIELCRDCGGYC